MEFVTLNSGLIRVRISDFGAEMHSILDRDGEERLWQGDPKFWANRAPIMFPVCSGLKEDAYLLNGKRYPMQKHGFARKLPWKLVYSDETIARYELTHQEEGFPFEYAMFAEYSVSGSTITVRYEVENRGGEVFYSGLGSHEAYRTFGGLKQCSIFFERPETLKRFILHGNLLADEYEIMGENVSCLPLKTEYFAVDALVFPYLKSREATLASNVCDKRIRVRYDGMDVLMLWTKPGADYVCIEPWTNAPDFESCDMNIEHKPGMIRLVPGANAVRRHFIEVI